MPEPAPTLLLLLDGWGAGEPSPDNAIHSAETPHLDRLCTSFPRTTLRCTGRAVGLPEGQMGNSEVGHLNIGAGRVVNQDIVRISQAIADGTLATNPVLSDLFAATRHSGGRLHLIGLVSDGGVHSHQEHLEALIDTALAAGVERICVHAILDGRDTPPQSGLGYMQRLHNFVRQRPGCSIATVSGRYYTMDRDKRWDRTALAYQALVHGEGPVCTDPLDCVQASYDQGVTDEFVVPQILVDAAGQPLGPIADNDTVFFFNFRADRARQLVQALNDPDFAFFDRGCPPQLAGLATMTEYDATFHLPAAFAPQHLKEILGAVVSRMGLRQLRIAETEKYAHVTYFFNGGEETPFAGEDRELIASPKDVATYDLKPEMSVFEVTDRLIAKWQSGDYALVVANFANLDMVGHTGNFEAAVQAVEAVDACVGRVADSILATGGRILLTADHGNADVMQGDNGAPYTAHSHNPVPFVLIDPATHSLRSDGILGDIAPTILDLWGVEPPPSMTGRSLLSRDSEASAPKESV
ncbi:2,3-bisphosphoglycerate-independent phosphoglycerate mutase [Desulfohalobium retbaense]|uniref:2,3-bisphosphoglycerate-independent phosphoglycerate mutase n=1 Tax=Desulfohalobium retbaense (strain ATCC 49708 / DSM 5692 / JCM 16813 / HR100) TaxID=485915 RepID=C8X2A6_DESRD|nr:2,3-bisphosphoglycerate-independent phosphoglycerate mutase [Desulfohalobium retbaense]ACV68429.1 phosphoglycerate mutase, 2,3-bisphosphoglycerate- independent [Desulfohalobium retbaense DSM 5692]